MKTYTYYKPLFWARHYPNGTMDTYITRRERIDYNIDTIPGYIVVNGFMMKVKDDCEFVYKLQKTQVKAIGGEKGLFEWIFKHYPERFRECLTLEVLNHIIKYGKK